MTHTLPTRVVAADFKISVPRWPAPGLSPFAEICFCGRSNVGKSSVLNALAQRSSLARTSGTPGRTQAINAFAVRMQRGQGAEAMLRELHFIDLPGYGFAKVPLAVKRQWRPMMQSYFRDNTLLRAAVALIDIRREPNDDDFELLEMLEETEVPTLLTITKIDKVPRGQRPKELKRIAEALGMEDWRDLRAVSAQTGEGMDELRAELFDMSG